MSISSVATELYTIQSKKKVPLKTAAAMMLREELSARFSVYNLVRIVTKSEFLATVARIKYGERTPLQKQQDKEEEERNNTDLRFKKFTVSSIMNMNRKLVLLTNISQRNSELISGLYNELGASRGQRRIGINNFNARAARVPILSKTIKGRLDSLNDEIQKLKKVKKAKSKPQPAKTKKEKEQNDMLSSFLPLLLSNPRLLGLLMGGTAGAVSLGTFAAQAYSLLSAPKAIDRMTSRFKGEAAFDDPLAEQISQFIDPALLGVAGYTTIRGGLGATSIAYGLKQKLAAKNLEKRLTERYVGGKGRPADIVNVKGPKSISGRAQRIVQRKALRTSQIAKWKALNPLLKGIGKRLPALAAADIAFELSRMSGYVADNATGKMNDTEFRKNMTNSYAELISTVGIGGISTIAGGLIGTAVFPGLGSLAGVIGGGAIGALASILIDEDNATIQNIATKVFNIFHTDQKYYAGEQEIATQRSFERGETAKQKPKTFTEKVADMLNPFGGTPAAGESVDAKYAMDFFVQKGWTPAQAAGIVGNLQQESGATLNTAAFNEKENAYGIAQWRNERISKFQEVFGKSIYSAGRDDQLEYVHWELLNSEKLAGQLLKGAGDFAAAAQIVDEHYERSAGTERAQRINNARELLKQYELRTGNARQMTADEFNNMVRPNQTVASLPVAEAETKAPDKDTVDMMTETRAAMIATNQLSNATIAIGQKVDQLQRSQNSDRPKFFVQNPEPTISSFRA